MRLALAIAAAVVMFLFSVWLIDMTGYEYDVPAIPKGHNFWGQR